MARVALTAIMAFLLTAGMALAADKEVKGTIVKVDVANKKITLKTGEGDKVYDVSAETKFIGPKGGKSDDGIKDARLTKGAAVTAKVAANNKTLHELYLPTTAVADTKTAAPKKAAEAPKKTVETPKKPAETPKKTVETPKKSDPVAAKKTEAPKKPEAPKSTAATKTPAPKKTMEAPKVADSTPAKTPVKTPAPKKTEAPAKSNAVADAGKKAPPKTDKPAAKAAEKKIPDNAVIGKTAADAPGTKAKIVKVDAEKKTLLVTMEDGKQMEIQASDDTKFIGPRGGVSQDRLKDDRLAVGYEVRLVMGTGKAVKEVHMSYRKRKPTDK